DTCSLSISGCSFTNVAYFSSSAQYSPNLSGFMMNVSATKIVIAVCVTTSYMQFRGEFHVSVLILTSSHFRKSQIPTTPYHPVRVSGVFAPQHARYFSFAK